MDCGSLPLFVVFGPQTSTWPSQKCLSHLRHDLLNEPALARFTDAVRNLPSLWPSIVEIEPRLLSGETHALQAFVELQTWLNTGVLECEAERLPSNALWSPLTVILHVVHYVKCVLQGSMYRLHNENDHLPEQLGLQGMCTGFLTTIAASLSSNAVEFSGYASVALHLAACIGVFVDLNGGCDDPNEKMQAIVVQWETDIQRSRLLQTMTDYPEAYTSVLKDNKSSTMVVPQMSLPSIRQTLLSEGIHVTPLRLVGRYHHSSNTDAVAKVIQLAHSRPIEFQFPATTKLRRPLRANFNAKIVDCSQQDLMLHEIAIKSLLTEQVDWHSLINATLKDIVPQPFPSILVIGLTNCLPREILNRDPGGYIQFSEEIRKLQTSPPLTSGLPPPQLNQENSIAIVGMAGRFPGADTLEEFWTLLQQAKSTLTEVPRNRFKSDGLRRSETGTRFWGNFIHDMDSFDRKFFKISSREATSMDPQQRLVLQVAVEAMQSAEYFSHGNNYSTDFGCYLGVGSVDYHDNIYSHQPTAYSAVGSLRAFLSGRIAHYFGWTGPSITYDTACSSSLVAIHSACKALLAGECSGALAGGVNIITSPALYQNLGAASFLSLTGASKAFDSAADGYCRGEGCGLVVLKKLSDAVAASDPILGVIAGSAINQSENCVSITVPHAGSQSALYRKVLSQSNLQPSDITYVEAHGTGTPVGDPIEWQSIRAVFGGPQREINSDESNIKRVLHVGSVKGNIGHLEAASGVAALIKSVLMIQKGEIPKQASFVSINPRITTSDLDYMTIAAQTVPWNPGFRGICVNNYGASGTNGALIVCQTPDSLSPSSTIPKISAPRKHLVSITAHSRWSLQTYCSLLLRQTLSASQQKFSLADYAFNLSHKQDLNAKHRRTAAIKSIEEFRSLLGDWREDKGDGAQDQQALQTQQSPGQPKPIILCFGGQSSNIIGLDKGVYETIALFRFHLDEVNMVLSEQGEGVTVYPHIFSKDPISNPVALHCSLFAIQYACAMSWIDSGVTVKTVIGHSFGQITALCISGVLSLNDAVRYVSGRASLFANKWKLEAGAMITARAADIDGILPALMTTISPETLEVACYNSSSDLVLAGSTSAVGKFKIAAEAMSNIEVKTLDNDRAFHSSLMDGILPDLARLAASLTFRTPKINIETCTQGNSWTSFTADNLVAHSRQPVFFRDAVKRVQQRLGASCIWLEAGSRSSIIHLVSKCISRDSQESILLPVDLSHSDRSLESLLNTTLRLCGIGGYTRVQYWPYHRRQRSYYKHINLPPYQFDMSQYWLEYKDSLKDSDNLNTKSTIADNETHRLLRFVGYAPDSKNTAVFAVNPQCSEFQTAVSGHAVMGNGLCPASLYVELAAQSIYYLSSRDDKHRVAEAATNSLPQVTELRILAPLGINPSNSIHIELSPSADTDGRGWTFSLTSYHQFSPKTITCHASGIIHIQGMDDVRLSAERSALERFVGNNRCLTLLEDRLAESMQGSLIYRVFDRVVNYKRYYQGIQRLSSKGNEVAGVVSMPEESISSLANNTLEPFLVDNFLQVAGLHVNCLRDIPRNDVYICTAIKQIQIYETLTSRGTAKDLSSWNVYGYTKDLDDVKKNLESDILVFNGATKSLAVSLLGVRFSRVNMNSLGKTLSAINSTAEVTKSAASNEPMISHSLKNLASEELLASTVATKIPKEQEDMPYPNNVATLSSLHIQLKELLSSFTDIPVKEINESVTSEALGIDSLMETEVLSEIRSTFGVEVPADEFRGMSVADLLSLLGSDEPSTSDSAGYPVPSSDVSIQGTQFSTISTSSLFQERDASKSDSFDKENVQSDISTHTSSHDLLRSAIETETSQEPIFLEDIHEAFLTVKSEMIIDSGLSGFYTNVHPRQLTLVTAYIVEAFDTLGCSLNKIPQDEPVIVIPHTDKHKKIVRQLHDILEAAGIISRDGDGVYKRTGYSIDLASSESLLKNILHDFPQHSDEHRLLSITGPRLADCLCGKTNAIGLIFGSRENKELLANVYLNAPMFAAGTKLVLNFLTRLLTPTPPKINNNSDNYGEKPQKCIRILEIGAGTGGTTKRVVSALEACNIPFHYTFSDISASLVATAKQKFAFCKEMTVFTVMDIEQEPNPEFIGEYDIVISTNCIHATRNLTATTTNIRKLLVPGGLLCLVELTRNLHWFDLVFGLLEGWWLFEDGRRHALASEFVWKECLMNAGYVHVDWTGGDCKESELLRLIIAVNSSGARKSFSTQQTSVQEGINQQSEPEGSGHNSIRGVLPVPVPISVPRGLPLSIEKGGVVLLTGATGSLGSHLVQHLLSRSDVRRVVCLNRRTAQDAVYRQAEALKSRNIEISPQTWSRVQIIESKAECPKLGLDDVVYSTLCDDVTHIVHNAWPMSFRRPLNSFEPQFKTLENLIQFARDIRKKKKQFSMTPRLLFVSSIGAVGQHSAIEMNHAIPEVPVLSASGLEMGYAQAKILCEKTIQDVHLEESEADKIETTFARIGQMTGARMNGVWNPDEHFPALLRSSQTVGALPRIDGTASWLPVDVAAAVVGDLLLDPRPPRLVYHVENPIRQSWVKLVEQLSNLLGIRTTIPYRDWLDRVQGVPDTKGENDDANPAKRLFDFFEKDFIRMDCGGVILDTTFTQTISHTLRETITVGPEMLAHYVSNWKRTGFLK